MFAHNLNYYHYICPFCSPLAFSADGESILGRHLPLLVVKTQSGQFLTNTKCFFSFFEKKKGLRLHPRPRPSHNKPQAGPKPWEQVRVKVDFCLFLKTKMRQFAKKLPVVYFQPGGPLLRPHQPVPGWGSGWVRRREVLQGVLEEEGKGGGEGGRQGGGGGLFEVRGRGGHGYCFAVADIAEKSEGLLLLLLLLLPLQRRAICCWFILWPTQSVLLLLLLLLCFLTLLHC